MNISSVSGSFAQNMYQTYNRTTGSGAPQNAQQPQQPGVSEESRESGAVKIREAQTNGEAKEGGTINTYA